MPDPEPTPTNGVPPKAPATPETRMVPYATFKAEKDKLHTVTATLAERDATIAELSGKAATAGELTEALERMKGEVKAKESAWGEERSLLSAGVTDPEDVDLVRYSYGRLSGDAKPKTIGDFLGALKADGAAVPRALAHLFGKPPEPSPAGEPKPRIPVPPAGGSGTPPPSGGDVANEAIRRATAAVANGGGADAQATLRQLLDARAAKRAAGG